MNAHVMYPRYCVFKVQFLHESELTEGVVDGLQRVLAGANASRTFYAQVRMQWHHGNGFLVLSVKFSPLMPQDSNFNGDSAKRRCCSGCGC